MAVQVRAGRREDFPAAVEVWRLANAARRHGRPPVAGHEARVLAHGENPDAFLVVAEEGGALVGMALGIPGRTDDGAGAPIPDLCHVSMVFVAPARWGEGIGGSVVSALLREAEDRGYRRAQLWTHASNTRAQRLYEHAGFVHSGRIKTDDEGDRILHYERASTP